MTEEDIRNALNDGMLEKARTRAEVGAYDEAFEYILSVLAVDPRNRRGNVLLIRLGLEFIWNPRYRQHLRAGSIELAELMLGEDTNPYLFGEKYNDSGELIVDNSVRIDASFLDKDDQIALLSMARRVEERRNMTPHERGWLFLSDRPAVHRKLVNIQARIDGREFGSIHY